MKKAKWLIYTVIIGLIPFLIRSFIALADKKGSIDYWIDEVDFIVFGLVLNLTNINELEDRTFDDKIWKTTSIGISVAAITFLSAILAIVTYSDFKHNTDLNMVVVKTSSIIIALASLIFSYAIYNRLNKLGE